MKPNKKDINAYPTADLEPFEFVMSEAGLPKVIEFMNLWAKEAPKIREFMIVRYEDLRAAPQATLGRVLHFLGTPATKAQIADAVEFASYDNMKRMEQQRVFWLSGGRLVPKDRSNPDPTRCAAARWRAIATTSTPHSWRRSTRWSRPASTRSTATPEPRAGADRGRSRAA